MKWQVKELLAETFRAKKEGGLTAYIYRSLSWPDFFRHGGAPAYEVKCGGEAVALIRFEGKGASVCSLSACQKHPELSELDLVELALWVSKLRAAPPLN